MKVLQLAIQSAARTIAEDYMVVNSLSFKVSPELMGKLERSCGNQFTDQLPHLLGDFFATDVPESGAPDILTQLKALLRQPGP